MGQNGLLSYRPYLTVARLTDIAQRSRGGHCGEIMPRPGINDPDRLLSKVELFPRRNSAVFLVSACLSKVELFLRRNSTAVSFSSSSSLSSSTFFISRRGCDTGVTQV